MSFFGKFGTPIVYCNLHRLERVINLKRCGGLKMKNMINDITTESAWKKASQFIQDKYGKKIEFRTLTTTSGDVSVEERVSYFSKGDDLVVPLKYKQTDLGQVIVCRGATLAFEQQLETVDLIQFLIEPQVYNRMLKLQINAYDANTTDTQEETNVINLFATPSQEEVEEMDEETSEEEGRRRLVSKFIHIRAKSSMARHKVAYKIHEMTGTIVFLRLQDLTDGKTKVNHEMDLSDTAIYVDNLTELNKNQLDLLERMARQNQKGNCVIIVGSSLDEDQIHHLDCSQAMKNDLIALSYDADRVPVSQQASEEILDLLFFNDDAMIS